VSCVWSPDGRQIAFTSNRGGANGIYIMNADGSGCTKLTRDSTVENSPAWSPDGKKIAFYSRSDGDDDIYIASPNGTGLTKLTDNKVDDRQPTWSPDGQQIAYVSRVGAGELSVMNADGSNPVKVADNGYNPVWVSVPAYPAPIVPQHDVVPQPLSSSQWPIKADQALANASRYLPADIFASAKTNIGYGWSGTKWGEGEPRLVVTFDNITVIKAQLVLEKQTTAVINIMGNGPYTTIMMSLSGLDGRLLSLFAFSEFTGWTSPPPSSAPPSSMPTAQNPSLPSGIQKIFAESLLVDTTSSGVSVLRPIFDCSELETLNLLAAKIPNFYAYECQISTDPDFPYRITKTSPTTSVMFDFDLTYGTTYYLRFRALGIGAISTGHTQWFPYSSYLTYTTPPMP
jgi:hypothetical protein